MTAGAIEILNQCHNRGVTLDLDGEHIRCRGRKGTLDKGLMTLIRAHKPELLNLLRWRACKPQFSPLDPDLVHTVVHSEEGSGLTACTKQVVVFPSPSVFQSDQDHQSSPLSTPIRSTHTRLGNLIFDHAPGDEGAESKLSTCVDQSFAPGQSGLTGLTRTQDESPAPVADSPGAEKSGLGSGLSGVASGLGAAFLLPLRWHCVNPLCRHGSRWWMSAAGVVLCVNCVPPAWPELVAESGTLDDAPAVLPHCTRQSVRPPRPGD